MFPPSVIHKVVSPVQDEELFYSIALVFMISSLLFLLFKLYIYIKQSEKPIRIDGAKPNYGVSSLPLVHLTWRFGFTLSILHLLFGLLYLPVNDRKPWLCNSFLSFRALVWPLLSFYFLISFLIDSLLIKWTSNKITSLMDLKGNEKVFLCCTFRGSLLTSIATKLYLAGKVSTRDPWHSDYVPNGSDWAVENCYREGISSDRYEISNGDPRNTDFLDEEFDVVVINGISEVYPEEMWQTIALELLRILKRGGKIIFIRSIFQDDFENMILRSGHFENVERKYIPRLPVFGTVLTASKALDEEFSRATPKNLPTGLTTRKRKRYQKNIPRLFAIISIMIVVFLHIGLYSVWDYVDIPSNIDKSTLNRFNSGFLSPLIVWLSYGLSEFYKKLKKEAWNRSYIQWKLFGQALLITFSGSILWTALWWLPTVLLDFYLIRKLTGSLTMLVNTAISVFILLVIYKLTRACRNKILSNNITNEIQPLLTSSNQLPKVYHTSDIVRNNHKILDM